MWTKRGAGDRGTPGVGPPGVASEFGRADVALSPPLVDPTGAKRYDGSHRTDQTPHCFHRPPSLDTPMTEPQPLRPRPVDEVPLLQAPLAAVVAQVRFSPILAIGQPRPPDGVVRFQEALRPTYPHLTLDQTHHIAVAGHSPPSIGHSQVWRLADTVEHPSPWRVSLAQDFVALETHRYSSRADFLTRLETVIDAVEDCFSPTDVTRLGLRYINRLTGAAERSAADLVKPEILGIMASSSDVLGQLKTSVVQSMMHAQFLAPDNDTVLARWGVLPPDATHDPEVLEPVGERSWVLDMDMFTTRPRSLDTSAIVTTATGFAECLYWLFRQVVTDDFLRHHGAGHEY